MKRSLAPVNRLRVLYSRSHSEPVLVGELAYRGRRAFFEYDSAFVSSGLELSPFHLPVGPGVAEGDPATFEGLFGLFDDSLPDGWGRLLLDRYVEAQGGRAPELSPLDRLSWVGPRAIGALSYEPAHDIETSSNTIDLHRLAEEAMVVLEDRASDALPELLRLGGSPQGARPKALVLLSEDGETVRSGLPDTPGFSPYLVKYPARSDPNHMAGAIEFAYSQMARAAGIQMPQTRLLARKGRHRGFFAIERFDRSGAERHHVHTVSGLLHAPPGLTFLSYQQVLRLAWRLTRDEAAVLELFRRAAFNVFAHNRDDHARNISFMMKADGEWVLAPAYDLTFSTGPGGEHTMTVAGEGRHPTRSHLERLAQTASLRTKEVKRVLEEVEVAVRAWPKHAEQAGVLKKDRDRIRRHFVSP